MSLTEEDVKRIIRESTQPAVVAAEMVQWLVRDAFEEGWRRGGGDPVSSPAGQEPVGWRAAWFASKSRGVLLRNKMITGEDQYK